MTNNGFRNVRVLCGGDDQKKTPDCRSLFEGKDKIVD